MTDFDHLRRAASAPAGEASSLPFWAYQNQDVYALEVERIFQRDWVALCPAAALSAPGEYLATDIAGEPVAIVRGSDGELRALSNVCRHRGTLLLSPGSGRLDGNIVCGYHAWTYSDSGAFRGAPYTGTVTIDPEAHRLPQFPLSVWMGVVFVSLSQDAERLPQRLAGAEAHLREFGLDTYDKAEPPSEEVWDANWKLILENAMESYHLFKVHAETLEKVTPTRGAYYIEGSAPWTVTGGRIERSGGFLSKLFGYGASSGDRYALLSIPPSFVGIATDESWDWLAVHPAGARSTRVVSGTLAKGRIDPMTRAVYGGFANALLDEDRAICERGQSGMASRHSKGGRLVELERVIVDFHHYLGWRLFGDEPGPRHLEPRR